MLPPDHRTAGSRAAHLRPALAGWFWRAKSLCNCIATVSEKLLLGILMILLVDQSVNYDVEKVVDNVDNS